jgi:tetratricopeptide (TPR) repeat protein
MDLAAATWQSKKVFEKDLNISHAWVCFCSHTCTYTRVPTCVQMDHMALIKEIEERLILRIQIYGPGSPEVCQLSERMVILCNVYGLHYLSRGEFDQSKELLRIAKELTLPEWLQMEKRTLLQAMTMNSMSLFCRRVGNAYEGLKYARQALELEMGIQSGEQLPRTYLNLAALYSQLKDHKKSVFYFHSALYIILEKLFNLIYSTRRKKGLDTEPRYFLERDDVFSVWTLKIDSEFDHLRLMRYIYELEIMCDLCSSGGGSNAALHDRFLSQADVPQLRIAVSIFTSLALVYHALSVEFVLRDHKRQTAMEYHEKASYTCRNISAGIVKVNSELIRSMDDLAGEEIRFLSGSLVVSIEEEFDDVGRDCFFYDGYFIYREEKGDVTIKVTPHLLHRFLTEDELHEAPPEKSAGKKKRRRKRKGSVRRKRKTTQRKQEWDGELLYERNFTGDGTGSEMSFSTTITGTSTPFTDGSSVVSGVTSSGVTSYLSEMSQFGPTPPPSIHIPFSVLQSIGSPKTKHVYGTTPREGIDVGSNPFDRSLRITERAFTMSLRRAKEDDDAHEHEKILKRIQIVQEKIETGSIRPLRLKSLERITVDENPLKATNVRMYKSPVRVSSSMISPGHLDQRKWIVTSKMASEDDEDDRIGRDTQFYSDGEIIFQAQLRTLLRKYVDKEWDVLYRGVLQPYGYRVMGEMQRSIRGSTVRQSMITKKGKIVHMQRIVRGNQGRNHVKSIRKSATAIVMFIRRCIARKMSEHITYLRGKAASFVCTQIIQMRCVRLKQKVEKIQAVFHGMRERIRLESMDPSAHRVQRFFADTCVCNKQKVREREREHNTHTSIISLCDTLAHANIWLQ